MLKKLFRHKSKGDGELVSSIVTLYVLIVFMLVFLDLYADLKTKDYIDVIVRNYTLQLETNSSFDLESLKTELTNEGLIFDTDSQINVIVQNERFSGGKKVLALIGNSNPAKTMTDTIQYGDIMTLEIKASYKPELSTWISLFARGDYKTSTYYTYRTTTSKN